MHNRYTYLRLFYSKRWFWNSSVN